MPINRHARNQKTDLSKNKKPTPNPTRVPPPTAHAPRSVSLPFAVILVPPMHEFDSHGPVCSDSAPMSRPSIRVAQLTSRMLFA